MKVFLAVIALFAALAALGGQGFAKSINSRIIGGSIARAGEFPYNAAIYYTTRAGTYFCGGALINTQWVVTAAHCTTDVIRFTIKFGSNHLSASDANRVTVTTDEFVQHPDYNALTLANDIALIKLRMPLTFTPYLRAVNLPSLQLSPGDAVIALGWGQTSDESEMEEQLHDADLILISDDECKLTYGEQVLENMICAAGNNNEGTCNGDSGGPLIQYHSRGQVFLIGISIFQSQNGCETPEPSGYIATYPYIDWINNVTGN